MNRGARLRTSVRTYFLTKAMQRRWHNLRQWHRRATTSHTGRQAFENDSIGKRGRATHSRHSPLWVVHACNSHLLEISPGAFVRLHNNLFANDHRGSPQWGHLPSSLARAIPDIHHFGSYTLATPIFWK